MRKSLPLLLCFFLCHTVHLSAATFTWRGGTGDWDNPLNWAPVGNPLPEDDVIINSGTPTLGTARTINDLTFTDGQILGTGSLTVAGSVDWTTGEIGVFFTLLNGGTMSVDFGGPLAQSPQFTANFNNFGSVVLEAGQLRLGAGVEVTNQNFFRTSSGVLNMGPNSNFFNFGTFRISSGGTVLVGLANTTFTNESSGTFVRNSGNGELRITTNFVNVGDFFHTSDFDIVFRNELTNRGNFNINGISRLTSAKTILFDGITLGPTATWLVDSLELHLDYQPASDVTINDHYLSVETQFVQPELIIGERLFLDSVVLEGNLTVQTSGTLQFLNYAEIRDTIENDGTIQHIGSTLSFNNFLVARLINRGSHYIQNSNIEFQEFGRILNSGLIRVLGDNNTFGNGGTIVNDGRFELSSLNDDIRFGTTVNNNDTLIHTQGPGIIFESILNQLGSISVAPNARLAMNQGVVRQPFNFTADQTLELSGGITWDVDEDIIGNLIFSDSLFTIRGLGSIRLFGTTTWNDGGTEIPFTIEAGGRVFVETQSADEAALHFDLTNRGLIEQRSGNLVMRDSANLFNFGTHVVRGGGGVFLIYPESRYDNFGDIELQAGDLNFGGGSFLERSTINNFGTFRQTGGTGVVTFGTKWNNIGTMQNMAPTRWFMFYDFEQSGTLEMSNGSILETYDATIDRAMAFAPGTRWEMQDSAQINTDLTLDGDVHQYGRSAGINRLIVNGNYRWFNGEMAIWTVVGPSGNMLIDGLGDLSLNNTFLQNQGTIEHRSDTIRIVGGGYIANNGGALYQMTGGVFSKMGTGLAFSNEGILELLAPGVAYVGNANLFNSFNGELRLSTPGPVDIGGTLDHIGTISGNGALNLTGQFNNGGRVAPGLSPGELHFNTFPLPGEGYTLQMEVAGPEGPGIGHDFISIDSTATTIGGTVEVSFPGGYDPAPGTTFVLVEAPLGLSGTFNNVNIDGPATDWEVTYNPTQALLRRIGALPLELGEFTGEVLPKSNLLRWTTTSETNTDRHELLRAESARGTWRLLTALAAAGNSSSPLDYQVFDRNPPATALYRLRTVDTDGTEHLSRILSLAREMPDRLFVAPNPAVNYFILSLAGDIPVNAKAELYSASGRLLEQHAVSGVTTHISTAHLAKGTYTLLVSGEGGFLEGRLVVVQ